MQEGDGAQGLADSGLASALVLTASPGDGTCTLALAREALESSMGDSANGPAVHGQQAHGCICSVELLTPAQA